MYFQNDTHTFTLLHGNSMNELPAITEKVDMIFADPPYFLSNDGKKIQGTEIVSVNKGDWDKAPSQEYIDDFNYQWISLCKECLKDEGTIWVCGTFHNIYSVGTCLKKLGFQTINVITWHKIDPTPTWGDLHFNFSSEYIIWARKNPKTRHYFNINLMKHLNNGVLMPDVWNLPTVASWEKRCGKHPTQKPLRLLYRIITASTRKGDCILDPFAGSCTTGIASYLLERKFIGIDQNENYLQLGVRRYNELQDKNIFVKILKNISTIPDEDMVMVNHAKTSSRKMMIEKGICYLRAGDSKGSLLVKPGFERLQYVLLHTNGEYCQMFRLKTKGHFQIWTKETLEKHGFQPTHAPYYVVLLFDQTKPVKIAKPLGLKANNYMYVAKIKPLSEFI